MEKTIEQIFGKEPSWFYQITDRFGLTRPTGRAIKQLNYVIARYEREAEKTEEDSARLAIKDKIDQYKVYVLHLQVQDDLIKVTQSVLGRETNTIEKLMEYITPKEIITGEKEWVDEFGHECGMCAAQVQEETSSYKQTKRTLLRRIQHCFEEKYGNMEQDREDAVKAARRLCDLYGEIGELIHLYDHEIVQAVEKIEESRKGHRRHSESRDRYMQRLDKLKERDYSAEKDLKFDESWNPINLREVTKALTEKIEEENQVMNAYNEYIEDFGAREESLRQERANYFKNRKIIADDLLAKDRRIKHYDYWLGVYDRGKNLADELDKELAAPKAA